MKSKTMQVCLSDQEYKEFMVKYTNQLIAGTCTSKSDYIRQMLGVNGSQPTKDAIQDSELDKSPKIADKEAKYTASQLSIDFGKLDV